MSNTVKQYKPFDAAAYITEAIKQIQRVQIQSICPHIYWSTTLRGQCCDQCGLEVRF